MKCSSRILTGLASLLVGLFALLAAEAGLRLSGFEYRSSPRYMEFNYPEPNRMYEIFERDPNTFWRLKPGSKMGPELEPVNSKGFRGPDFSPGKDPETIRIVTMGDSVTFGGKMAYPRVLQDCLGDGYQVINAGVPGYSVYQGLKQYQGRIVSLKPDAVTVMFGWNDHWLARGYPDFLQKPVGEVKSGGDLLDFVRELRLYQLAHLGASELVASETREKRTRRVPLDKYREFLGKLVDSIKSSGAEPVLLTAPAALDRGVVPQYLFEKGFIGGRREDETEAEAAERLRKLHSSYNDVVREISREKGALLVDFEAKWYEMNTEMLFRDPSRDIIHPNERGYSLMGQTLCDTIKKNQFPD